MSKRSERLIYALAIVGIVVSLATISLALTVGFIVGFIYERRLEHVKRQAHRREMRLCRRLRALS